MTEPPWTYPALLASVTPIQRTSVDCESVGVRVCTVKSDGTLRRMPGIGGRFSTIFKSKVSKMLDKAEDPQETLDYSYEKQLELLQNVKKGIADVVTSKKRLQMQSGKLE